jgi:hypothetical protein
MLHVCPHNGLTCIPGHSAAGRAGARNRASAIARLPPPLERRGGALRSRWHGAAGRSSGYSRCAGHLCKCLGCSDGGSAHFIAEVAARPQVASFLRHCLVSVVQMGCRWQQLRRQHGGMRCTASAAAQMARCWLPAVSCASCRLGFQLPRRCELPHCTHMHAEFQRIAVSARSAGDAMEAAVRPAHTNGIAGADTSDGSRVDALFDAGDIFTRDHNGRVVFSNGVSKQPMPQRRSILHVWDIT